MSIRPRNNLPPIPDVSVVMPIYNSASYLAPAVRSILVQTFTGFELLLADDGSIDASLAMARQFEKEDPRVRVLEFDHRGIANVNHAVEHARADLVARMDSDDIALPQRLEKQVAHMRANPACVAVGTWLQRTDPTGSPCGIQTPPVDHTQIDRTLLEGDASAIVQGTALFRKDALLKVGGWRSDFDWVEDLDLFLRLAEVGTLANVPECLYQYRRHLSSICATRYEKMVPQIQRVLAAAWERRGLPGEPDLQPARRRLRTTYKPADYFRSWACYAIQHGNGNLARRHALSALRHDPWSIASWRVARWALVA